MALYPIRGLSLCAGAGGLDLALKIAMPSYRTVCYVEREAFAASALVARMEDAALDHAPIWDDLTTFDGKPWRGAVDLISAGYPCQPFSVAGKRNGHDDPRHLWPHVARIIRESNPRAVFLENVPGHLSLGFEDVAQELETLGYSVAAGLFSAEEIGASHRRERLFILADHDRHGLIRQWLHPRQGKKRDRALDPLGASNELANRDLADADSTRLPIPEQPGQPKPPQFGRQEPAAPEFCRTLLPLFAPGPESTAWPAIIAADPSLEPSLCRVADGVAYRVDRLRLCGNGVVPLAGALAVATLASALTHGELLPQQYQLDL